MSEKRTENSEFHPECEVLFMSAVAEASSLLREIAEPRPIGDTVKAAITRAARRVGLRAGRVEDIWRQEARAIRAEEMDAIRRAVTNRKHMEEARAEALSFSQRLERLERQYLVSDEDFHSPQIDALRGTPRVPHCPLAEGGEQ